MLFAKKDDEGADNHVAKYPLEQRSGEYQHQENSQSGNLNQGAGGGLIGIEGAT